MRDFANLQDGIGLARFRLHDGWLQRRAAEVCVALALSPAFAWICPFGTDEQSFLARLGYWCGVLVSWFMLMAVTEALLAERRVYRDQRPTLRRAMVIGLAALPMIVIAGAATHALTGWEATVPEVAELYWQIVLLGTTVALLAKAVLPEVTERPPVAAVPAQLPAPAPEPTLAPALEPVEPPASSPLLLRLPPALRGRLLCLEMEDHYVRVHTDRGSALLLLRLKDAIAETHPLRGQQVHRSWWVSEEAVQGFERVGRVGMVRLSNGSSAPVSQRYLREVEASFS